MICENKYCQQNHSSAGVKIMIQWQPKKVKVSQLKEYEGNPRDFNELEEWEKADISEFQAHVKEPKVIIYFKSEKQREKYVKEKQIIITKKNMGQWTARP